MERATRERWATRVHDWKHSGLTAESYAQRAGLNAGTLLWWSSQLGRGDSRTPPVVEVVMTPRGGVDGALEVVLASGIRVAVPAGFDQVTLQRLLAVLEGR